MTEYASKYVEPVPEQTEVTRLGDDVYKIVLEGVDMDYDLQMEYGRVVMDFEPVIDHFDAMVRKALGDRIGARAETVGHGQTSFDASVDMIIQYNVDLGDSYTVHIDGANEFLEPGESALISAYLHVEIVCGRNKYGAYEWTFAEAPGHVSMPRISTCTNAIESRNNVKFTKRAVP